MFNPNAEVFVIFYPHGAGGRFLYSVMCLDTSIVSPAGASATFDELKEYLGNNENAHANNSEHLTKYIPKQMQYADRYVFCVHQREYGPSVKFLQSCKNLKIIIITIENSIPGFHMIDERRKFLGRKISDKVAKATYCIKPEEIEWLEHFAELISTLTTVTPELIVDIKDYWNPNIAIPLFNKYFADHNINCDNWEELYHVWLANSIKICLK